MEGVLVDGHPVPHVGGARVGVVPDPEGEPRETDRGETGRAGEDHQDDGPDGEEGDRDDRHLLASVTEVVVLELPPPPLPPPEELLLPWLTVYVVVPALELPA